ncbi:MAG: hypothetical protein Q4E06_06765, partial [Lautropia sp.]|nr:hypothetical protein [Lautropia sp.]
MTALQKSAPSGAGGPTAGLLPRHRPARQPGPWPARRPGGMQATAPLPPRGQGQAPDYRPQPRRFRRQRLLIIGCGDIGRRVGTLLKDRWQVIGLARSDDTRQAIRQAGLVAQPAPVFGPQADRARTRLHRLAAWATHILHSAPPPTSSSGNGNGNGT